MRIRKSKAPFRNGERRFLVTLGTSLIATAMRKSLVTLGTSLSRFLICFSGVIGLLQAEADDITWTSIGPGGGGWMTAIAIHPQDGNTVYISGDIMGIFKSTDSAKAGGGGYAQSFSG